MTKIFSALRAAAALLVLAFGLTAMAAPASADLAASKAVVDAAKAQGTIGEQGDGFLAFVGATGAPSVVAAMQEINAGRAGAYADAAQKTGTTEQAAGEAAAAALVPRLPAGQYYKPIGGNWTKK